MRIAGINTSLQSRYSAAQKQVPIRKVTPQFGESGAAILAGARGFSNCIGKNGKAIQNAAAVSQALGSEFKSIKPLAPGFIHDVATGKDILKYKVEYREGEKRLIYFDDNGNPTSTIINKVIGNEERKEGGILKTIRKTMTIFLDANGNETERRPGEWTVLSEKLEKKQAK